VSGRSSLKASLRSHVPPALWDLTAAAVRTVSDALSRWSAATLTIALRLLPDSVRLALRQSLDLKRPLDYHGARIWLHVTSPAERWTRLRSCEKEPETVEWIERSIGPGDVLYDVGANVGAYSLVAAKSAQGRAIVYAFEPGYRTFASLVDNIALNEAWDVIIPLQVALSDHTGLSTFLYSSVEAGTARHPGVQRGFRVDRVTKGHDVLVYRLDDFVRQFGLRSPTHLKLDVDGGELGVLAGASQTLRSEALRSVLVELVPGGREASAARQLLSTYGFALETEHSHGSEVANHIFVR
jgi:FkbM family methyltransferase